MHSYTLLPIHSLTRLPMRSLPRLHTRKISTVPIKFVPQQSAYIVERMGKFHRIMNPGLGFIIPIIENISYTHSLKETAINIPSQSAITQDNVSLELDGVLYIKVIDPYKASYGVHNPEYAIVQLAQTTMRSEIGMMTLDKTLAERAALNLNIVEAINHAAEDWGIRCLRYEIRDIHPPESVVHAMHSQVSAERQKRAYILDSEGRRQAEINVAEGQKQAKILTSEAEKREQINLASGESEAILLRASATAAGINQLSSAIGGNNGKDAVGLTVAEKYIEAFSKLAKSSTTVLLPWQGGQPSDMIAQAMTMYKTLNDASSREISPSHAEKIKAVRAEEPTRNPDK